MAGLLWNRCWVAVGHELRALNMQRILSKMNSHHRCSSKIWNFFQKGEQPQERFGEEGWYGDFVYSSVVVSVKQRHVLPTFAVCFSHLEVLLYCLFFQTDGLENISDGFLHD